MNRRIDDLLKGRKENDTKHNVIVLFMAVFILLVVVFGLILLSTFVGFYVAQFSGKAGFVYELVLGYHECAAFWSGVAGAAVMVPGFGNDQNVVLSSCGMYEANFLYSCLQPGMHHVIMASQVPSSSVDWATLRAATTDEADNIIGMPSTELTNINKTFTEIEDFQVGSQIYNVPGTRTRANITGESPFKMGVLIDGNNNLIFIASVGENFTKGFNNKLFNYQMILPIPNGTNPTYFFFTDPYYQCPAGEGTNPDSGFVEGNVTTSSGDLLEGVIVDIAGKTTVTDVNGYYKITVTAGNYYIFGIRTGYQAYVGNVTVTAYNTTRHDFVMVPEAIPNPNTGMGVGPGVTTKTQDNIDVGPGKDIGPGEAPKVPVVQQPKRIEGIDYIISIDRIDRKLLIGNFLQEVISFYSYKKSTANLQFRIEDDNSTDNVTGISKSDYKLSSLIKFDKDKMSLAPNSNDQLAMTIFGEGKPGDYNGTLVVEGDLNERIPVHIELLDKNRLPVEALLIMLDIENRNIFASEKLKFKTDLHNLLSDQSYAVELQYTIQDSAGKTIWTDSSNVYVQTSFSLIKSATLPDNIPTGDYVLRVTANYLGLSSGSSTTFKVVLPFYEVIFWGLKVWMWIAMFVFLIIVVISIMMIRKYIQSKKKYSFKLEMSELPKPGPRSVFVGKIAETDHKTYFDLEQFKVHTIVAGATGGGKSVAAQVIVEEALLKGVAVIVFDPTAQWSGMLRKCTDKFMLSLYPNFGMKPTQARAFNGNVKQITNALELIDIRKYVRPGEIQILACNKLDPKDIDLFVANSIREVFHANFNENAELRLFLVYDEVHRLLPKFGGSGEGFLQIERGCREFRKWGIGILMISQVLADFVGQIKANINTEVQMRTRDEGDLARIKEKYGGEVLQGLVKASVGSGMVENPTYNRGRPYFVAFRPLLHNTQRLPDEELEKYNKWNEVIEDLDFQLQQLEELKQDVFDLKLQLKLALDKVKSGNFNMVEIYLQEVIPRVQKFWDKLGKKPQKRVVKTVDISALKEDMKKAAEEKKKIEEDAKKNAAASGEGAAKVEAKKVLKYDYTVGIQETLNFNNGINVASLQELSDVMPNITSPTLKHHVTKDKNDIADWVLNKFKDQEFADKLRACKTTDEFVKVIAEDKAKNNKPIDVSKLEGPAPVAPAAAPVAPAPEASVAAAPAPVSTQASASSPSPIDVNLTPRVPHADENSTPITPQIDTETGEGESVAWNDIKSRMSGLGNDEKMKLLEKAVKKYPDDINIKFPLAMLYQKSKDLDKAERIYKEIISLYPRNTQSLFYLGGLMKSKKEYDEALKYLNLYMDLKKDDTRVQELIGQLNEKNRK